MSVLIVAVIIPAAGAVRTNGRINTYRHMADGVQALYEQSRETPWPVAEARHDYNNLMGRSEGTAFLLAVENDSDISYAKVEFVLSVYTKRGRLRGNGRIGVEILPAGETVEFPGYLTVPGVRMKQGDFLVLEADEEIPFPQDWRERFPGASFQVEEDLELLTGAVAYTGREDLTDVRVAFVSHSPAGVLQERFWCDIGCLREGQEALYRHSTDRRNRSMEADGESEEGTTYRLEGISYTPLEEGLDAWQDSLEFREGPVLLQDATPLGESGPLVRGTVVNTTDQGILSIVLVVGAYNQDGQKIAEHHCRNYGGREGGTGFFPGSPVEVDHNRYFYTGDMVYRLETIVL